MYSPRIARPMCISMYAIHVRYMDPRDTYHDTRIATAQVRNTLDTTEYKRDTTEYICDTYCQCIPYESDMYSMFVSYVWDTIHTWFAWNTLTIRIHVRYIIQSIPGYMYTTCILRTYYAYLIPYHLYHLSRCAWVEEGTEQDEKDERGPGSWGAGHLTAGDE